jgi:capsule polysaccharide export protein KpsE/RkpR
MSEKHPTAILRAIVRDSRARTRIAIATTAFALAGFLYGLLAPKWYRPVLTIVPVASQKPSFLGSEIGGLAAGLAGLGAAMADGARIVAVLQSNSVTDAAIDKFDLMSRFGARYRESARDEVWRRCDAKVLTKPNLVQVSCEDTDPRFAQQLLEFLAERGNEVFRRVSRSSASEEVRFLEARASELRLQTDEVAAKVREFQEKHQLVDLDSQAKALVSEAAALYSQRVRKQVELGYAKRFSLEDEATTRQLESQLAVLEEKLGDLEARQVSPPPAAGGRPGRTGKAGMFPPATDVPRLRAEYEKLHRDRLVAEASLVYVLERLEGARAAEARNVSTFQVLDTPGLATRKTRPFRLLILVVATLVGLLCSLAYEWRRAGGGNPLAGVFRLPPPPPTGGRGVPPAA